MVKDSPETETIPDEKTSVSKISFEEEMKKWPVASNTVLLLLPMSGENSVLGQSISRACLLASQGVQNIDFHIIDTAVADTVNLYEQFKYKNINTIIGPVFYNEIGKYAAVFGNAQFFSLSNNVDINNQHVMACGLSPQEELSRIFGYIKSKRLNGLLMIIPNNSYSDKIVCMAKKSLAHFGFDTEDFLEVTKYRSITRKDATRAAVASGRRAVFVLDPILNMERLGNKRVFTLSSSALANRSAWDGVIFAFGNSDYRNNFIDRYKQTFHKTPTTIDMVAYDVVRAVCDSCINHTDLYNAKFCGCLGDFAFKKRVGIVRNLQLYKLVDSEEIELERESEDE